MSRQKELVVEANPDPPENGVGYRNPDDVDSWFWKSGGWHLRVKIDRRRSVMLYRCLVWGSGRALWYVVPSSPASKSKRQFEAANNYLLTRLRIGSVYEWMQKPDAAEAVRTLVATAELMGLL